MTHAHNVLSTLTISCVPENDERLERLELCAYVSKPGTSLMSVTKKSRTRTLMCTRGEGSQELV